MTSTDGALRKLLLETGEQDASSAKLQEYRARLGELGAIAASKVGRTSAASWSAEVKLTPGGPSKVMTVTPPTYVRLDRQQSEASAAVRAGLTRCGILEHRALATGAAGDADAYIASLAELDVAMVSMWALEAFLAVRRRSDVADARLALSERTAELAGAVRASIVDRDKPLTDTVVDMVYELRGVHAHLRASADPPAVNAMERLVKAPAVTFEDKGLHEARIKVGGRNARVREKAHARQAKRWRKHVFVT